MYSLISRDEPKPHKDGRVIIYGLASFLKYFFLSGPISTRQTCKFARTNKPHHIAVMEHYSKEKAADSFVSGSHTLDMVIQTSQNKPHHIAVMEHYSKEKSADSFVSGSHTLDMVIQTSQNKPHHIAVMEHYSKGKPATSFVSGSHTLDTVIQTSQNARFF